MKARIISDSSCDLPDDFLKKDGIDFSIVPLKIIVGDQEFIDDEDLDTRELLLAMKEYKEASSTACPAPEDFARELRKNLENYVITITSGLSGTFNSARVSKDMVVKENPDTKIALFDSLATSSKMILMIMKLRDMLKADRFDFETIAKKLADYQDTLELKFLLQDLSNLVKTGRMSKIAGVVASALSIIPICRADEKGEIQVIQKIRGVKKALSKLANSLEDKVKSDQDFPVVITHCNNPSQAQTLKEMLETRFNLKDIYIFPMRGLTTYYANDQALLMAY